MFPLILMHILIMGSIITLTGNCRLMIYDLFKFFWRVGFNKALRKRSLLNIETVNKIVQYVLLFFLCKNITICYLGVEMSSFSQLNSKRGVTITICIFSWITKFDTRHRRNMQNCLNCLWCISKTRWFSQIGVFHSY